MTMQKVLTENKQLAAVLLNSSLLNSVIFSSCLLLVNVSAQAGIYAGSQYHGIKQQPQVTNVKIINQPVLILNQPVISYPQQHIKYGTSVQILNHRKANVYPSSYVKQNTYSSKPYQSVINNRHKPINRWHSQHNAFKVAKHFNNPGITATKINNGLQVGDSLSDNQYRQARVVHRFPNNVVVVQLGNNNIVLQEPMHQVIRITQP